MIESIAVLCHDFSVRVEEHPSKVLDPDAPATHEALGCCNTNTLQITVRGGLPESKEREVVLHETLHAIVSASGIPFEDDDSEETLVNQLAPHLLDVLRSNPQLVRFLLK